MPLLSWFNRDADLTRAALAPYRLLEPVARLSHGDVDSSNMLIEGDNLDALKALLPYYAGQVKCIFIDPPYNTKSAFEQYDDNLEHAKWLSMMYPRLELLRKFLSADGSIWITIDDNEGHYLKVILDELFGRGRFVATCVWQKRYSRENREAIGDVHDYLMVFAEDPARFKKIRNRVPFTDKQAEVYRNIDPASNRRWRPIPMTAQGYRANQMYSITAPGGAVHVPPEGRCWSTIEPEFLKLKAAGRIYFGKNNNSQPNIIRFLDETEGVVPWTWWPSDEVGHTDEAAKEQHQLMGKNDTFATPKPERLIKRILDIATNPGDLVLDSFLGSGTTAAVAHKMGRRWIGIEEGQHARSHCQPRMVKVVEGEQGGISAAVGWKGGGGFRFYKLGVPVFDENGHIRESIRFEHLAAHVWFAETGTARSTRAKKEALLGEHAGVGYYLLFNGILGDDSKSGGNVLTKRVLRSLAPFDGPKVIYGEACALPEEQLRELEITFKQTPYDIKAH
ncbi:MULTISPECIES: site-specific DNA-methyltransferase [Novilysobacter]|uniref:site-specific DNA-methyltransferase n=1 Tax=Novilysobacter TaxID=3382699 RepID=UPI002EDB7368